MLKPRALIAGMASLYFFRVPILMSAALMLLWWNDQSSMISGLYVGDRKECFGLAFALTLVAGQTLMLIHLLQLHRHKRLGMAPFEQEPAPDPTRGPRRSFGFSAWVLSIVPWGLNIAALYALNAPFPPERAWTWVYFAKAAASLHWDYVGSLAGGVSLSGAIMVTLYLINNPSQGWHRRLSAWVTEKCGRDLPSADKIWFGKQVALMFDILERRRKAHSEKWSGRIASVVQRFDVDQGIGFVQDKKLRENLLDAAFFACFTLVTYLVAAWIPTTALFYVLLWLSLGGWLFAFLCFWFDRYRVPFVTLSLLWGISMGSCARNGHYYFLAQCKSLQSPATSADLFKTVPGTTSRVIIVSSEGGGIHAAAWTARVLTGVAAGIEPKYNFMNSVRMLSGTSGGSVGNMFFQALYDQPNQLHNRNCWDDISFESRNGRGLDNLAHGIVYHDIRRPLFPFLYYSDFDRGNSLEMAWRTMLEDIGSIGETAKQRHGECTVRDRSTRTVDELSVAAATGERPLLIFNATLADSGWPLAVTNFDLSPENGIRVFHDLYHKDINLTTAVRLSASFPYVAPAPRPLVCALAGLCVENKIDTERQFAVTDGGLYDNYGVAGAYEALAEATNHFTDYKHPVLWLQIRSSPYHEDGNGGDKPIPLASSPLGPLLTLFAVRGTGQAKRADGLSQDALLKSHGMLTIVHADFPFEEQPLSWKLTKLQADKIDLGWNKRPNEATPTLGNNVLSQINCFFDDGCRAAWSMAW